MEINKIIEQMIHARGYLTREELDALCNFRLPRHTTVPRRIQYVNVLRYLKTSKKVSGLNRCLIKNLADYKILGAVAEKEYKAYRLTINNTNLACLNFAQWTREHAEDIEKTRLTFDLS